MSDVATTPESEAQTAAPAREFRLLEALLLAVAFAVTHTQSPLYFSNQNQYFLHGLADAGVGHLSHDWLAQTRDPTPVFSALVSAGFRYLGEWSFQAAYFVLLMGYFLSVRWLVSALPGVPDTRGFRLLWAAGFIAAHAALLRVASVALCGVDYPWFLQAGVAGQYVLGPGLQPSAFGVLLIAGVAAFANGRLVLACAFAGASLAFHATYLLPVLFLVFGFLVVWLMESEHSGPRAFAGLLAASVFAVPVAAYMLFTFGPENQNTFNKAQNVLAEIRIPHHCNVERWFDEVAGVQCAWALLGIALLWRSRLFLVFIIAATLGIVGTLLQHETGNPTFALAFPWRISVVLVPVATAVILARLAALVSDSAVAAAIGLGVVLFLALGGVWVMAAGQGYHSGEEEEPLYEYIRTHAGPKDVYLLPVRIPPVGTGKGAMSATFTPPPRPKPGSNLIPVNLQRFRLHTGSRVYADFKSVPYADTEVLEWLRRMRKCETWHADWNATGLREDLRGEGVTHIIAQTGEPITVPHPVTGKPVMPDYLEIAHTDAAYIVYKLK